MHPRKGILKLSIRALRQYVKRAKSIGRAYYVTELSLIAFLENEQR